MNSMTLCAHRGSLADCIATSERVPATRAALIAYLQEQFEPLFDSSVPAVDVEHYAYDTRISAHRFLVSTQGSALCWVHYSTANLPFLQLATELRP